MLHARQHIINEDSISRGGIVDQNMGDGADELAVLDDGAAAHTLDDAAGFGDQIGIGDGHGEAFVGF